MTRQRASDCIWADVIVIYAQRTMTAEDGDLTDQHKEWFSRSFLVSVAAAARFPVELTLNDVDGVDATVRDGGVTTDWQLKGTSSPLYSADGQTLFFDLDVRTYALFTGDRNSSGFLGVVVMPTDQAEWVTVSEKELALRHCGFWQKISGMPATTNSATVRIHLPITQRLTVQSIHEIMVAERERISA